MLQWKVGMQAGVPCPGRAAVPIVDTGTGVALADAGGALRRTSPALTALRYFRHDDLRRYEAMWRQARRVRRHVPPRGSGEGAPGQAAPRPIPTAPPDDVRIVALQPTLSIKTHYSTADVLDAFAAGARPFESLAAVGADVSAHGAGEFDPLRRATFLRIGAILDTLTGLNPKTFAYRLGLGVCGTASKLLKGGRIEVSDLFDITMLERHLATPAPRGGLAVTGLSRPHGFEGAETREGAEARSSAAMRDVAETRDGVETRDDRMREAVSASRASRRPLDPDVPEARAPVTGDAPPPSDRFPDDAVSPANDIASANSVAAAPLAPTEKVRLAAAVIRERAREHLIPQRGDDPALRVPTRFAWRLNGARERSPIERADAAYDRMRGPALYTRVGNVPLLGRRASEGGVVWESMPLSEYVAPVAVPRTAPQRFDVSGVAYIGLDGLAYRVREIEPGVPWVVHAHSGWPPLPLTRGPDGAWALKPADLAPVDFDGPVGNDGFLRTANRKFIRIDGKTIEVAKDFIFGEEDIRRFAHADMGPLEPAALPGTVRGADGAELIEGRYGYYRLQRDGVRGPYHVGEGDGRCRVRFDADRDRWNVVPGEANPERADAAIRAHKSMESKLLSPTGRRASMRKNSEHSIDSLRRFQNRIGRIGFLQARPLLRAAIDDAFLGIVDLHVRRPNRLPSGGGDLSRVVSMRQSFFRTMTPTEKWNTLTIAQKQRFMSEKVFNFYARGLYLSHLRSDALCHEMTDFMTAQLMQSSTLRKKILQIEFRELPGSGLGHAAVLYADDAVLLNRFGKLDETDPVRQSARPRLERDEFLAFVHANRNKLLLIDPWGLEKVVDLSTMTSAQASGEVIDVNLRAAGFGAGLSNHYRVAALLPELPRDRPAPEDGALPRSKSLPNAPDERGAASPEPRGGSDPAKRPSLGTPHGGR